MKRHVFQWLYTGVFLLLCLIPSLGMTVIGPSEAAANEVLAQPPKLRASDGNFNWAVLSDTTDYIADRFALRQQFVTAWAKWNALLGTSVEDKVILGGSGWLYYNETRDDYMGVGLTDEELSMAAGNLALMQEYAESRGAQFLFTIAPNKNSLYPEQMPGYIPHHPETSNAARFPDFLAGEGVAYTDLFSLFRGQDEVLYYATDSHWTVRGAALAADTLLDSLGRDSAYFRADFSQTAGYTGDLYEMLYPAGQGTESAPVYGGVLNYTTDSDPNGGNAITIRTHGQGSGNLLCFRDSFGIALYPYLADAFGESLFSRQAAYDLTQIDAVRADTVLIELVERNLWQLVTYGAIFPAPARENLSDEVVPSDETVSVTCAPGQTAGTADLVQVTATLSAGLFDDGAPVYLLADGVWYEACRLVSAREDAMDISAWLPADAGGPLHLMTDCGGVTVTYACTVLS